MILSNFVDLVFIAIQLNPPPSVREAFSFLVVNKYKHTWLFCEQCSVAQHTGCSSPEHQQSTLQYKDQILLLLRGQNSVKFKRGGSGHIAWQCIP